MTGDAVTRVGLQLASFAFAGVRDRNIFKTIREIALTAEQSGFDSIWTMDHVHQISTVGEDHDPIMEAYTTLAAIAAITQSARLGVLVSATPFRNPALVAKMITTIDVISGGRAILGLGAGWHADEFRAYGYTFPSAGERLARLREAVRICRSMFVDHRSSFAGQYYETHGALNVPPPLSPDGPPILIGGGGERVLIPLVAEMGDACNFFGAPATVLHKIKVLEQACAAIGRDPREITKTWLGSAIVSDSESHLHESLGRLGSRLDVSPQAARGFALCGTRHAVREQIAAYRAAGVDGLIVTTLDPDDLDHLAVVGETLRHDLDG